MQVHGDIPALVRGAVDLAPLMSWVRSIHVVGVAGTGLRGLVRLLHARGVKITGSELLESPVLESLRDTGIICRVGHSSGNLEQDTNLVLISAAVQKSNPEVRAAEDRHIPVWKYAQCLGSLMAEKEGIAVAGTHGKTTTSTMVATILHDAGLDPTFVIGGEYAGLGGSSRCGKGPHFVAEACEFDRSFLNLRPRMSVVTNIEEDHLDYFKSLKDIQGAFSQFVSLLPEDGHLVVNRDDPNSTYLSEFCRSSVATYSIRHRSADWWADDIRSRDGLTSFLVGGPEGESARMRLQIPGLHNVSNALAATAVCRRAGLPLQSILRSLEKFTGVRRRFDVLHRGEILVVDDYAHHPTEIRAVARAARQSLPERRLVGVFQPHQHSRLKRFRREFAEALTLFDKVIVLDVFRARDKEEDVQRVHSSSLVEEMRKLDGAADVVHASGFPEALETLGRQARKGDAVLFMGAGDVTNLARQYAQHVYGVRP